MQDSIRVSLSRELTLFDITVLGIAGMIGAGIFALTGIAAGIAGPAILVAFLLNGVVATLTGLAYAELGSSLPEAGGGYLWVREAMGDFFGFLAGWSSWAAHSIACSLYAVTFGAFFSEVVVQMLGLHVPQALVSKASAIAIVSALAYVNFRGVKESGRMGGIVTLLKIAILLLFVVFGIYRTLSKPDWISAFTTPSFMPNGMSGVLAAMGLTYIAFEGYEIIVQSGEEVKNPERNIPRAILISLWVVVIIYVLVAFSALGAIESDVPSWMYLGRLAEFSMIRIADQIMPFGSILIVLGGLISTVSAMNATIYSSSRVAFAMGRDRLLPAVLSKVHERNRTPHYSVFFSYLIIAVMAVAPIEAVATAADIMFLLLFIQVNLVLIVLRYRRPDVRRAFRVPLVPYVPLAAVLLQAVIGYYLVTELKHGSLVLTATAFWIVFGYVIYVSYSRKERIQKLKEEAKTIYEEKPIREPEGFKILVPVANPVVAEKLAKFAEIIAKERDGEVVLLNVVILPEQTPLSAATRYAETAKEFLKNVIKSLDIPAGGIVKIGHRNAEAILNAIEEVKPDLVVLGWRGRTFRKDFVLGSTIDPILLRAKCDVAVVRFEPGEGWKKIESILIPTAGGPHAVLAAEIARDLSKHENARITLMYVGKNEKDRNRAEKAFEETSKPLEGLDVSRKFVVSSNAINAIAREAGNYSLVMLGASSRPFLKNFLLGVFPEKVVSRTSKTVVMTRKWVRLVDIIKKK
ncbi:amino acid permease [Archaeoglobus veneficus]|uniref:Amino acid permease-associated region n=1 Tax=Archaeoglobus veneficus (strain DSM 11195 / SNP6) TaxID=693661 RepID=F2KQA6_ARCVS|nr:amino acid permease [Archaeoglobus veneficus]AEA46539.1 amino acid permease-associated region [Archaeoglobus veneficus SNP6]